MGVWDYLFFETQLHVACDHCFNIWVNLVCCTTYQPFPKYIIQDSVVFVKEYIDSSSFSLHEIQTCRRMYILHMSQKSRYIDRDICTRADEVDKRVLFTRAEKVDICFSDSPKCYTYISFAQIAERQTQVTFVRATVKRP